MNFSKSSTLLLFLFAVTLTSAAVVTSKTKKTNLADPSPYLPGAITFDQYVFNSLMTIVTPAVTASFQQLTFPQTAPGCTPFAFYEGNWVNAVQFDHLTSAWMSTQTLQMMYPMHISGLPKQFSWTSFENKVLSIQNVNMDVCFQICSGSAPFTSTTTYEVDISFPNLGSGTLLEPTVSSTTVNVNDIVLQQVNFSCITSQSVIQEKFTAAMASVLPNSDSTTNPTFLNAYKSVFSQTSPLGYSVASTNKSNTMFSNEGVSTTLAFGYPEIEAIQPVIRSVFPTKAGTVPGTATPECVTLPSPCTAPMVGPSVTTNLTTCVACIQSLDGVVYLTTGAVATFTPNAQVSSTNQATPTKHKKQPQKPQQKPQETIFVSYKQEKEQQTFFPMPKKVASEADKPATNSEMYASIALFNKLLDTTTPDVTTLIGSITTPAAVNAPLTGTDGMCKTTYSAFTWKNLLPTTPLLLTIKNSTKTSGAVTLQVTVPLSGVYGNAPFTVECQIPMPVGPPAVSTAAGTFNVSLDGDASAFEVFLDVSPQGVIVNAPFTLTPAIAYSYNTPDENFLFDSFVKNYFRQTLAQDVATDVVNRLNANITHIMIDRVFEVSNAFTSLTHTIAVETLSASVRLRSGDLILSDLDTVVPKLSVPHPEEDSGSLSVLSTSLPPFSPSFCSGVIFDSCSDEGVITQPIPTTLALQHCTMCVTNVNGQVVLGVRYISNFSTLTLGVKQQKPAAAKRVAVESVQSVESIPAVPPLNLPKRPVKSEKEIRAALSLTTAFYLGTATLTQASLLANTQVQAFVKNYAHAPANSLTLPYLPQCAITHQSFRFANVPDTVQLQVMNIVTRNIPNQSGSAVLGQSLRVQVAVNNLPQRLFTQVSPFDIACTVNVDLPMNMTTSHTGKLNVSLLFQDAIPKMELELIVEDNTYKVHAVSTNITNYVMSTTYVYDGAPTFVFDPYGQYYSHTTLLNEIAQEFQQVMVTSAGAVLAETLTAFLSQVSTNCPLNAVNGTHVVAKTGSSCASELPTRPPVKLNEDTMWYVLNAGPLPAGVPTNSGHSANDFLKNCTNAFPLSPFQSQSLSVEFVNCSTYGIPHNGNWVVGSYGALPMTV